MKKWHFEDIHLKQLAELIQIISPSMDEKNMVAYLRNQWQELGTEVKTDIMGNIYATLNRNSNIHIALVAHMDSVAIQITKILSNGMLQFRSIGLRSLLLLGQNVKLQTSRGILHGVIGYDPLSQEVQNKGIGEEDLWLDIGADSYESAASIVEIGDMAVLVPQINKINDNIISGSSIDNRVGIFILNECIKKFSSNYPNICLHLIGSVQEEVGLRGASIIASQCKLDACFVIDVDYATDTLAPHDNQMGYLHLGKGVGLHIKSDNNPILRKIMCDVANEHNITYQKSLGRYVYGGTDATPLQLQSGGVATVNVNIPCRYMHSPIEMIHLQDVENAINLLILTIKEIADKKITNFVPF